MLQPAAAAPTAAALNASQINVGALANSVGFRDGVAAAEPPT